MTKQKIEALLMIKSGFNSREINLIKSVEKRDGIPIADEINLLGNRFYTLWISRWIATARECSQQRGNLKDNGYISRL
ncbi:MULTISPECIES: hypothetical protein [unclassified Photorhabdus]|uniref:hypothetical protein n=1 Tax=unclassified Photorhabdus TaxID=2620880 RepID=UPI000DCC1FBD|nr:MULTISPECIES: hypothetical protein [unclassified Photorhabdus]RAX01865.1 hypothetical protein CKY03_05485 [Photorhabdus sp. S9-53]RAX02375.1 hypothetical protein CKY05_04160 [Photorhabdus sp. S10-54]RAX05414.1 hypothetical protein CKY04_04155 [Photorhabdus sp. S8-52]